jgi:hypothetical protein
MVLYSFSSSQDSIPTSYLGQWKSENTKITVRKKTGWLQYDFIPNYIPVELEIHHNMTASGKIGLVHFENARVLKNKGNPEKTGIVYIIQCGSVGKLFASDPTEKKTIELWIKPIQSEATLLAEVRLKETFDVFPMGECKFIKAK